MVLTINLGGTASHVTVGKTGVGELHLSARHSLIFFVAWFDDDDVGQIYPLSSKQELMSSSPQVEGYPSARRAMLRGD